MLSGAEAQAAGLGFMPSLRPRSSNIHTISFPAMPITAAAHPIWIEATRYLNMDLLAERLKEQQREAGAAA